MKVFILAVLVAYCYARGLDDEVQQRRVNVFADSPLTSGALESHNIRELTNRKTNPLAYEQQAAETENAVETQPSNAHKRNKRDVYSNDYVIECWFTNWAQYRPGTGKFTPQDYTCGMCTHIFYGFGWMNDDCTVRNYDPTDLASWSGGKGLYEQVNDLRDSCPQDLITSLSIGGWTFRDTGLFPKCSASPSDRATFIASAINFVRQYKFDGIDIDWEYPSTDEERDNFSLLLNEFRVAVDQEAAATGNTKLLFTVDVGAGDTTVYQGYDIPAVAAAVDFVNLMSYDYHGAWEAGTGINAPLYGRKTDGKSFQNWNVKWSANYWADNGMPAEKVIIGIATYGRGWTLASNSNNSIGAPTNGASRQLTYTRQAGVASFYEICAMLDASNAKTYWDDESESTYSVIGDQWYTYDNEKSITIKMNWLKDNNFGGAQIWDLAFDDFHGTCPDNAKKQKFWMIATVNNVLHGSIPDPTSNPIIQPTTDVTTYVTGSENPITNAPITDIPKTSPCLNKADGFHPDVTHCGQFLLCISEFDYIINCPAGFQFSPDTGYCMVPADANCVVVTAAAPTPEGPTPPEPGTTPEGGVCTHGDGIFPDPSDCTKFDECAGGISFQFQCPLGTAFNPATSNCDFARNVPGCT